MDSINPDVCLRLAQRVGRHTAVAAHVGGREVADGEAQRGVVEVACVLRDGVFSSVGLKFKFIKIIVIREQYH